MGILTIGSLSICGILNEPNCAGMELISRRFETDKVVLWWCRVGSWFSLALCDQRYWTVYGGTKNGMVRVKVWGSHGSSLFGRKKSYSLYNAHGYIKSIVHWNHGLKNIPNYKLRCHVVAWTVEIWARRHNWPNCWTRTGSSYVSAQTVAYWDCDYWPRTMGGYS
jgi:hypothetical protein